jgi:hypothetical protein
MKITKSYLTGLASEHAEAQAQVVEYTKLLELATEGLKKAQARLDSAEYLIKNINPDLDTSVITPTRAWKGRYGERGNLRKTLVDIVNRSGSVGMTAAEITKTYCEIFGQPVAPALLTVYKDNRIRPALRELEKQAKIKKINVAGEVRWASVQEEQPPSASPMTAQVLPLRLRVRQSGGSRG